MSNIVVYTGAMSNIVVYSNAMSDIVVYLLCFLSEQLTEFILKKSRSVADIWQVRF